MCGSCLTEYGGPVEMTPVMTEARAAVVALYRLCSTGGPLHAQVDDMNVDDRFFDAEHRDSLPRWAEGEDDPALARAAFDALAPLTPAERATVCYEAHR